MKKNIKGWAIPTIKSVTDELKWMRDEWHPNNRKDLAIEITSDGDVYGGLKPSLANTCFPRSIAVGNHNGRVYETYGWGTASDYALTKEAKRIIELHIWRLNNNC